MRGSMLCVVLYIRNCFLSRKKKLFTLHKLFTRVPEEKVVQQRANPGGSKRNSVAKGSCGGVRGQIYLKRLGFESTF